MDAGFAVGGRRAFEERPGGSVGVGGVHASRNAVFVPSGADAAFEGREVEEGGGCGGCGVHGFSEVRATKNAAVAAREGRDVQAGRLVVSPGGNDAQAECHTGILS